VSSTISVASAPDLARRALPWLLLLYGSASLLHFAHNAEYLAQYPNLPPSWSRTDVYLAWCSVTTIGVLGYFLYKQAYRRLGLLVLALYAGLGFAGLLHYTRAPFHHHTASMNLTILTEVAAASLLLIDVASIAMRYAKPKDT
jgi:hypothetical protein